MMEAIRKVQIDREDNVVTINELTGGYHSFYDEPSLVGANGILEWHKNGGWHREGNKPAIVAGRTCLYYYNDRRHRTNGQAAVGQYWIYGYIYYSFEDYFKTLGEMGKVKYTAIGDTFVGEYKDK